MKENKTKLKTAVVVGFGNRSQIYSKFSLKEPDMLKIVGVVEPDKVRRDYAKKLFNLSDSRCYNNFEEFIKQGKIADCVINGTMDNLHIKTSLPILKLGYDLLLEKPITSDKNELIELQAIAKEFNSKVIICHVLRYTPFYKTIKEKLIEGIIGEIRHIETSENVGVAHASVSFIRGKWNNKVKCGSSYLLAKCCHDLDMICWLNNSTVPKEIFSMGDRNYFIPEKAPKGAGNRCLVDCSIEKECRYSCQKINLDNNPIPDIVWNQIAKLPEDVTMEEKIESLKTNNPHGRCIFKTDADLVDQQMTMIKFKNGSTAYHNLQSSVARAGRRIIIYGSKGEIEGFTEENKFTIRLFNPENILFSEQTINITDNIEGDNHYGGDSRIMYDFIRILNNQNPSISTTSLDDSIFSHLCVYAADESMQKNTVIKI